MIKFDILWRTMEKQGVTERRLKECGITERQIRALKNNNSRIVTTRLIDKLCAILSCQPGDVMENR